MTKKHGLQLPLSGEISLNLCTERQQGLESGTINSTSNSLRHTPQYSLLCLVLLASFATAQEPAPKASDVKAPSIDKVTVESIDAALKTVEETRDLDPAKKAQIKELYGQAKAELQRATAEQKKASEFQALIKNAPTDIAEARQKKTRPPQGYDFTKAAKLQINQLRQDRATLEQQLTEEKNRLLRTKEEPQRRAQRKEAITAELSAAQAAVDKLTEQLKTAASEKDLPALQRARIAQLRASQQAQMATVAALEAERSAYEAQGELPRLQVDLITAQIDQIEQDLQKLEEIIRQRSRMDAQEQKGKAEQYLTLVPAPLKPDARRALDLVNRRLKLVEDLQQAAQSREAITEELERWQKDFARTRKLLQAETTSELGMILVRKRASLPSGSYLRRSARERTNRIRNLESTIYELEDRRSDLSGIEEMIQAKLAELSSQGRTMPANGKQQLRDLYQHESQILDSLITDMTRYHTLLTEASTDQQALLDVVKKYHALIDVEVLWLRSARPVELADLSRAVNAIRWLTDPPSWREAGQHLVGRVTNNPISVVGFGLGTVLLLFFRPRIRRKLEECARVASAKSCRSFAPTSQSLGFIFLLAMPWAWIPWGIGWALDGSTNERLDAISTSLLQMVPAIFLLDFIRKCCFPRSLVEAHFNRPTYMSLLRSNLSLVLFVGVPLALLFKTLQHQRSVDHLVSLGRLCLVSFHLLLVFLLYRSFRGTQHTPDEVKSNVDNGTFPYLQIAIYVTLILGILALSCLALVGYQYTSYRLTVDLFRTFELGFFLWVLRLLLFRWVLVKRRRLRWEQLSESSAQTESDESERSDIDELVAKEEEVNLVEMSQQIRQLINILLTIVGLFGLSTIWFEVFPSLTPIFNKGLWNDTTAGGAIKSITVGDVLAAVLIVVIMIQAARNVSGLVDLLLSGRMGIETPTRYAITTLTQYAIVITGVIVTSGRLGFTWGKVQWLIAAMGVGLGFGLQEIVANFICGILLLIERPIRVGDTITVGNTTGIVIRIRSRATTVRNWDRQEVVIPNKELITGRIVNWTLSDQVNRVVIQVGIAYESKPDQVYEILCQIANENPNVLDEPRTLITFDRFGDNALNFTLRACLANMDERLSTIHDLHVSIHQRFAEEGIEIAFPQRDLHLRSVDPSVQLGNGASDRSWQRSPEENNQ